MSNYRELDPMPEYTSTCTEGKHTKCSIPKPTHGYCHTTWF